MAEQRRFEVGQKVRVIRSASERQEWSGRIGTVKHHRTGNSYGVEDGDLYCVAHEEDMKPADISPTADPVVERHPGWEPDRGDPGEPAWDSEKYNGLADWTPLDKRIAAVKAEHTRQADSSGLLHPKEFWSTRRGGRRNG